MRNEVLQLQVREIQDNLIEWALVDLTSHSNTRHRPLGRVVVSTPKELASDCALDLHPKLDAIANNLLLLDVGIETLVFLVIFVLELRSWERVKVGMNGIA